MLSRNPFLPVKDYWLLLDCLWRSSDHSLLRRRAVRGLIGLHFAGAKLDLLRLRNNLFGRGELLLSLLLGRTERDGVVLW